MPDRFDPVGLLAGHLHELICHGEDAIDVVVIDMAHHEQADRQLTVAQTPRVLLELVQAGLEDAVVNTARPTVDHGKERGFRVAEVKQERITVGRFQGFERKDHGLVLLHV